MHGGILGVGDESGPCEVVSVEAKTLNQILVEHEAPVTIDYLSVDVEGAEDRVFEGIDFGKLTVTAITVERPSSELQRKLTNAGFLAVREIPGLDTFYIHGSHADRYLQNLFAFYKKRHVTFRWK